MSFDHEMAAVMRSNAAMERYQQTGNRSDFEEAMDALGEAGLITVSVDPVTGEKKAKMTAQQAAAWRRVMED